MSIQQGVHITFVLQIKNIKRKTWSHPHCRTLKEVSNFHGFQV
jgi:hypothetical protein